MTEIQRRAGHQRTESQFGFMIRMVRAKAWPGYFQFQILVCLNSKTHKHSAPPLATSAAIISTHATSFIFLQRIATFPSSLTIATSTENHCAQKSPTSICARLAEADLEQLEGEVTLGRRRKPRRGTRCKVSRTGRARNSTVLVQ